MGSSGKLGGPTVSTIKRRIGITPGYQDPRTRVRFSPTSVKKKESNRGNWSRAKCEGREMGRGSLSIFIVAFESRVTFPREPVSSEGGYRGRGLVVGNTL